MLSICVITIAITQILIALYLKELTKGMDSLHDGMLRCFRRISSEIKNKDNLSNLKGDGNE